VEQKDHSRRRGLFRGSPRCFECLDDWISRFEDLGTLTLSLMLVRTSLEGLVRVEGSSSFRDLVNDLISLVMDELNSGEKE